MPRRRVLLPLLSLALLVGSACENVARRNLIYEHVLNRIGFGPDAWSRAHIREIGLDAYIEEQLDPSGLDDSALEAEIASLYPVQTMSYASSRLTYHEYTGNSDTGPYAPIRDSTRARVLRAVKSKKQLEQMLVDFWFNHFNVDAIVDEARWGFVTLERDAIRPHVFGKFKDMLRKVAQNPGMLDYLDNSLNFKEAFVYLNLRRGINENYAREILELHTLGVDGGYTHQDMREVARAFTGWTIPVSLNFYPNGFQFLPQGHDNGAKSLFGGALVLPANRGQQDGLDVISYLAAQPQTAERVSRKLVQRFVSEAPPAALVEATKQVYLSTDGDLREVMRTILGSLEFRSLGYADTKVKRPLHFTASLARAVGVADDALFGDAMDGKLQQMGEGLYRAGPPTGYPESSRFWAGEGAFVMRMKLAWQATHGEAGFAGNLSVTATTPTAIVDELIHELLHESVPAGTRQGLIDLAESLPPAAVVEEVAATLLASPAFLRH